MTISWPYTGLLDYLGVEKITWDIEEFKEHDMQGSGHDIDVKLAPSKWKASMVCRELYNDVARKVAAIMRKADGRAFMIYDPSNPYPVADPGGLIINGGVFTVQVGSLGGDGASLSLKGLPPAYKLSVGDRGQIVFASGIGNYYFEFSEEKISSGAGVTTLGDVWPPIPIGINIDATVILSKPCCKMKIGQTGFSPGQSSGNMTFGTTVTMLESIND